MEAFGREARESVPYVLGRLLPVGTSLQTWYERYAPRLIGRNQASDTSSSILARIQALEQIQVLQAGGSNGGSLTSVKIDDVPHAFHDLKIDKVALNKRQVQFLEMRSSAPALLRPSLELYARAMGYLASDDVRRFQATIAQARQELQEALARQQSIARALRQAESEYVPATRRFSNYLDILSRHRKSQEKLLPLENP
jgi:hypothetical protein